MKEETGDEKDEHMEQYDARGDGGGVKRGLEIQEEAEEKHDKRQKAETGEMSIRGRKRKMDNLEKRFWKTQLMKKGPGVYTKNMRD